MANNSAADHFLTSNTGFLNPSNNSNDGSSGWSNANGAYANGGTAATDSGGHKHRVYNFNIPSLSGYTINGIEIKTDSWVQGSAIDTGYKNPLGQVADTTVGNGKNGFEGNPTNALTDGEECIQCEWCR